MTNEAINISISVASDSPINTNLVKDENSIIVLPEGTTGDHVGLQVHWRLSGTIEKDVFNEAIKKVLPEKLLPMDSTDGKYLKRALETLKGSRQHNLVRRTASGGFSLVHEEQKLLDLDVVADENAYDIKLNATLTKDGDNGSYVKITPADHPQADMIRQEFERQRTLYHVGTDLSQWLSTRVIPQVNGVSGRDRGGFYYIPAGDDVQHFQALIEAVHGVSQFDNNGRLLNGIKIYAVPAVLSGSLVEALSDSLAEEVESVVAQMEEFINEDKLGARAWVTKRSELMATEKKLSKFGDLLGISLTDLKAKLEETANNIGYLEARRMAEEEGEPGFQTL